MRRILIYQSARNAVGHCDEKETAWIGFSLTARSTRRVRQGPPLFLFHSLLSDRASFDAIAPQLVAVVPRDRSGIAGLRRARRPWPAALPMSPTAWRRRSGMPQAARRRSCSAMAMAVSSRCRWRSAIPASRRELVLADCGAAFSEPGREAFRNMAAARRPRARRDHRCRDAPAVRAGIPGAASGPDGDRRAAFLQTDEDVFRAACAALAEPRSAAASLHKVKVPALVLVGEHDEATPPPMSHELAACLPNARLKIIAGCAHVPQLQAPKLFLDTIGDFLPAASSAPAWRPFWPRAPPYAAQSHSVARAWSRRIAMARSNGRAQPDVRQASNRWLNRQRERDRAGASGSTEDRAQLR